MDIMNITDDDFDLLPFGSQPRPVQIDLPRFLTPWYPDDDVFATDADLERVWGRLATWLDEHGVMLELSESASWDRDTSNDEWTRGVFDWNVAGVWVRSTLSRADQVAVALHETAHVMHWLIRPDDFKVHSGLPSIMPSLLMPLLMPELVVAEIVADATTVMATIRTGIMPRDDLDVDVADTKHWMLPVPPRLAIRAMDMAETIMTQMADLLDIRPDSQPGV